MVIYSCAFKRDQVVLHANLFAQGHDTVRCFQKEYNIQFAVESCLATVQTRANMLDKPIVIKRYSNLAIITKKEVLGFEKSSFYYECVTLFFK